jgi:DnaK suppressor protein
VEAEKTSAIREELEAQRASLRRELEELGYGSEGLSYDPNFADSSQVTAERGETEALASTLTTNLVDVEHALAKMAAGTYGTCESCRGAISEARLEAMPAARYCIDCAAKRRH